MKAAIYAPVSTERQAERGTIGSQVEALRAHVAAAGDDLEAEYRDDGHSGARLDRPGLDALRDAAEAGLFQVVWCLSPDRLARSYAYQVLIFDELARFGVTVRFTDAPALDEQDPQARLLTQVQGVIAEYERAKIAERYRRGKLYRSRAGEVISRKAPYGYRRIPRGPDGPARLEIFEPEAAVVRQIFAERAAGTTIRQICRQLNADAVPTPTGSRAVWGTSTLSRILANEAYIGRVYFNRTEAVLDQPAKTAYRARLRELEEELNEATSWADPVRAEKARQEMQFLADQLAAAVGLGGRNRTPGSPAERARVNITKTVKTALSRIRAHSPALAGHLDATIHTGTFCCYTPDPRVPVTWHT